MESSFMKLLLSQSPSELSSEIWQAYLKRSNWSKQWFLRLINQMLILSSP